MEDELGPDERSVADLLRAEGQSLREEFGSGAEEGERFWLGLLRRWSEHNEQPLYACPRCYAPTTHPKDIEQGYCVRCHDWTGVRLITDVDFEEMLDAPSLGSPQARAIQAQCPPRVREKFARELDALREIKAVVECVLAVPEPAGLPEGEATGWQIRQVASCLVVVVRDSRSPYRSSLSYWARVFEGVFERLREL